MTELVPESEWESELTSGRAETAEIAEIAETGEIAETAETAEIAETAETGDKCDKGCTGAGHVLTSVASTEKHTRVDIKCPVPVLMATSCE